jgi:hypothetical protein
MFDKFINMLYKQWKEFLVEDSMEEQIDIETVPTSGSILDTKGITFGLTELKVKIDSLARESWFIRLQENKIKRKYTRSHSKIITKYLESDEDFIDNTIPPQESFNTPELYKNFRMKKRYQKAMDIAKENHPEFFERNINDDYNRQNLHEHRVKVVSRETRASLLAYGFIRRKLYANIETDPRWKWNYDRPEPDWKRVADIVFKFSSLKSECVEVRHQLKEEIERWKGN